jgi:hypothetical protein
MLVYPGQQVGVRGVIASMRLKWLRDGVQDYEYIQILKNIGKTDLAIQIARSVGPDWTHWTRDAGAIDSARQQLGQTIDQIMTSTPRPLTTTASSAATTRATATDR